METVEITSVEDVTRAAGAPVVLAVGFFDGVHRGHQRVIEAAKEEASRRNARLGVMTFDRYPKLMFQGMRWQPFRYLTSPAQKAAHFAALGADVEYILTFDETLAEMAPQDFVDRYIVGLNTVAVVAGEDFTFGNPRVANMHTLPQYAKGRFGVLPVTHLLQDNDKISSTRIRKAIDGGDVQLANRLLGYPYETNGYVVHGFARGRRLGFPTLNIADGDNLRLPAIGVYAVQVNVQGTWYNGMASLGRNETFGDHNDVVLEINLFDFDQMVYGQFVKVRWFDFVRGQQKFASADELVTQLKQDRQTIQAWFAQQQKN